MPELSDSRRPAEPAVELRHLSGPDEIELFNRLPYTLNDELADDLEQGRRRPEWMWLALRDGQPVARAAWWKAPDAAEPELFDILDFDESLADDEALSIGGALLDAARAHVLRGLTQQPEYGRYLPADWREQPATRRGTELRMALLERLGARLLVERLRLEWQPGTPIAEPDPRLSFRPAASDEEWLDLLTRALDGTLDVHCREDLARMTPRETALGQWQNEFARFSSPREWWRVAENAEGEVVGFVLPARNSYHHIVAYLAVLPEHRGNGYIDGILTEGTRVLAEAGAPRVRASTDVPNVPMARAFERGGYRNFERTINMGWD
ncbi:GNAT family N-acetyltransferase [Agromyces subbeticus]|uniref:GNAT family N-acetyltransferase n=1 Tax=Agromyces subbeticus TaxID=293890 RepID=UPI0003B69B1D|nr:GNAT family N-acetyltransferase [Agromyces subbeticus]